MTKVNQQELIIRMFEIAGHDFTTGLAADVLREGAEALKSLLVENERYRAMVKRAYDFANQTMRVDFTDRQNYVAAEILAGDCRTLLGDSQP